MKHQWKPGELLQYEQSLAAAPIAEPPGTIIEDVLVPARGFLRARLLQAGQVIRFIDIVGQQVPDLLFFDPDNLRNVSSMTDTRQVAKTWQIGKGHTIYAKMGQAMATIVEDTVGMHATPGGFCNPTVNELRYGIEGTHSCLANLVMSMMDYGLSVTDIQEGIIGLFMNLALHPDGTWEIKEPTSNPGDYADLRAEMDVILAVSNCPSERNPCNGWNPTPMRVLIYRPHE